GVERLNVVVLDSVIFVAESEVEGEAGSHAPTVFEICSPVVEAEAARKARLSGGQSQCASGSLYHVPQYISAARKLALRIDGHLEQRQPSSDQVVERGGSVVAKLFDGLSVSAERSIDLLVIVQAAETYVVLALGPGQIFGNLRYVLRSAKGLATGSREFRKQSGQLNWNAADGCRSGSHQQFGHVLRSGIESLVQFQPAEAELGAAEECWSERVVQGEQSAIVELLVADIVLRVGTGEQPA